MNWRSVEALPPCNGLYFCWHPRWGRVVLGYSGGWGNELPTHWLDADGFPDDRGMNGGGAEVLT